MNKIDKDELRKSLLDFDFTPEEVELMIEKAEKDGQLEDKKEDDTTIDEDAQDKKKEDETEKGCDDEMDVKKAYDKIMSMKADLDKSIEVFYDKFGNAPGFTIPTDFFTKKAVENDIEKSEVVDIEKAFGDKFNELQKGFNDQNSAIDEIRKSLVEVSETVNKIAQAPNPFKSLMGKYQFLEKGEKFDENGKQVINLKDKDATIETFSKAIDKIEDEADQNVVRNMLSDYTISRKTSPAGLNIVKKALSVEFEK